MNDVNKTLYIPLYGKAKVSKMGIILQDKKAEEIWEKEGFRLKSKAKSKWLAYFMAMRASVFDDWVSQRSINGEDTVVLHVGCGLDSRCLRVKQSAKRWYDIDFSEVIAERKKYYREEGNYAMLSANAAETQWVNDLQKAKRALVVMEGVSMYLTNPELQNLFRAFAEKYACLNVLTDVYTTFGAKASKYKNPINAVGVNVVYGLDDPLLLASEKVEFVQEHTMTPQGLIDQLKGFERFFFQTMFAGAAAKKIYRLFEYRAGE